MLKQLKIRKFNTCKYPNSNCNGLYYSSFSPLTSYPLVDDTDFPKGLIVQKALWISKLKLQKTPKNWQISRRFYCKSEQISWISNAFSKKIGWISKEKITFWKLPSSTGVNGFFLEYHNLKLKQRTKYLDSAKKPDCDKPFAESYLFYNFVDDDH